MVPSQDINDARRVFDALQRWPVSVVLPAWTRFRYDSSNALAIVVEHLEALESESPGYSDPETSYFVFSAQTLLGYGRCCGSRCRHCPFTARRGDELALLLGSATARS